MYTGEEERLKKPVKYSSKSKDCTNITRRKPKAT
jgi:hypothetical protein